MKKKSLQTLDKNNSLFRRLFKGMTRKEEEEWKEALPLLEQEYEKCRQEKIENGDYHKIINRNARLKHKLSQIAHLRDMDIRAVIHFSENGEAYLLPAIEHEGKLFYNAEKKYIKNLKDTTTLHYYDVDSEEGVICHALIPETFKVNPNLNESIVKKAKELDYNNEQLQKEFSIKGILSIGKSQLQILKYAVCITAIGGFGCGCVFGMWIMGRIL